MGDWEGGRLGGWEIGRRYMKCSGLPCSFVAEKVSLLEQERVMVDFIHLLKGEGEGEGEGLYCISCPYVYI